MMYLHSRPEYVAEQKNWLVWRAAFIYTFTTVEWQLQIIRQAAVNAIVLKDQATGLSLVGSAELPLELGQQVLTSLQLIREADIRLPAGMGADPTTLLRQVAQVAARAPRGAAQSAQASQVAQVDAEVTQDGDD
jgi:hypothetical protein